jgi:GNAT superfamily N-acetyltransferase
MNETRFTIRPYQATDRPAVRLIYGIDEFARPRLASRYARMSEYIADEASYYYTEYEPESLFVAEVDGNVVGALLGCVDTSRHEMFYKQRIQPLLIKRCLTGAYGWPGWLIPVLRTELASRHTIAPQVDRRQYPAHLHIGILPAWRRQGIGSALMAEYADYLRSRGVAGYHLFASAYHYMGVAFYRKLGLELLGEFTWRLHDGTGWVTVTEQIYGKRLAESNLP